MAMRRVAGGLALLLSAGAAPQARPDLVLDCYVKQYGGVSSAQFVRHLVVDEKRRVVVIADSIAGATPRFLGNGQLVTLSPDRLIFDFSSSASSGRTDVDRTTGAFAYDDGHAVLRGTCSESAL